MAHQPAAREVHSPRRRRTMRHVRCPIDERRCLDWRCLDRRCAAQPPHHLPEGQIPSTSNMAMRRSRSRWQPLLAPPPRQPQGPLYRSQPQLTSISRPALTPVRTSPPHFQGIWPCESKGNAVQRSAGVARCRPRSRPLIVAHHTTKRLNATPPHTHMLINLQQPAPG